MNVFTLFVAALPALALMAITVLLIVAMVKNVNTGKQVREKLANDISSLRYSAMLQHESVDQDALLHRIPLVEVKQEMARCHTCEQISQCDSALNQNYKKGSAAQSMDFCPNIDAIHEHKLILQSS